MCISSDRCCSLGRGDGGVAQCLRLNSAPQKVRYALKFVRIYQQKHGMGKVYTWRISLVEEMHVSIFPPVI